MNHLGTVRIDTDRLVLRKFNLSDWINNYSDNKFYQ
jgi:hypothetical protein